MVRTIEWDIEGIIHTDKSITPLPTESRVVTEIFQSIAIRRLKKWASSKKLNLKDNAVFGRGYPDVTLEVDGDLIAIDIKSARIKNNDKISTMTLGTYNGYFLHPNEKKLHQKTKCYNDYSEHWIISIIYEWHPNRSTADIVNIKSICVGQKWQFAGKTSGSGDTANIGGIGSLKKLQNRESVFKNNEEFESYWRSYSLAHPRRGMQRE